MRTSISFSEWQAFKKGCHWRWNLDYNEGHRYDPEYKAYGIHLDFGTCVHEAIEKHKTRKDPVSEADAQDLFESKFRGLYTENSKRYREHEQKIDPDDFVRAGRKIIEHLKSCDELSKAEVIYNEHELKLPISRTDGDIEFKGYIDMVIRTVDKRGKPILYVIDFKTCSWGWDQEKKQDRDLHAQLFLYKHFLCKKFDLEPTQVRCAFVLLKRAPRKGATAIEFFPVSAGPVSVQRALDELNSDVTEMRDRTANGTLEKDFKKCVNSYGDTCPYAGTKLCPGSRR